MRISASESAAVVVDVQTRLYPHMFESEGLAERIILLIKGLRLFSVPMLATQQYTRGLGPTLSPVLRALKEAGMQGDPAEKLCFSCMDNADFRGRLQQLHRRRVILVGIESHVCVAQTALDLLEAGMTPVLIADCVSSRREADKQTALSRLAAAGAVVTSAEAILFELCREAGTDTFRALSRLVK